jgi:hypothetical protein
MNSIKFAVIYTHATQNTLHVVNPACLYHFPYWQSHLADSVTFSAFCAFVRVRLQVQHGQMQEFADLGSDNIQHTKGHR